MPIPAELLNRKFDKSGFSGYKAADIDLFMQELSAAAAKENRETAELQRRLQDSERALASYKEMEESIKNAMLSAQRLADQTKKDACEQSDAILREAELKAQKIVQGAEDEIAYRKQEAVQIKEAVVAFRRRMMKVYREHIELLSSLPAEAADVGDIAGETLGEPPAAEPADQPEDIRAGALPLDAVGEQVPAQAESPATARETPAKDVSAVPKVTPLTRPAAPEMPAKRPAAGPAPETQAHVPAQQTASAGEAAVSEPVVSEAAEAFGEAAAAKPAEAGESGRNPDVPVMRLNLRYNEKTGEYETSELTKEAAAVSGDGLRFGSQYDIRSGHFRGGDAGGRK